MEEAVKEMQVPIKPSREEKKWIRSPYNWGGIILLIQFVLINAIAAIVVALATVYVKLQPDTTKEVFDEFVKSVGSGLNFTMILANLVGALITYPIVFLIGCKGLKVKARTFFSTKSYNARFVILALLIALGAQLAGSYLSNTVTNIFEQFGITFTTIDTSIKNDMTTNIMLYVLSCISAPIFEEMIFRGLMLIAFSKVSIRFGIIASSALFGLFHQNIPQAIYAFSIGLVLGYVAYKAGSIIPAIILHFALNANSMLQEAIFYYFKDYSQIINIIWTIAIALISIAVIILNRNKFSLPRDTKMIKKRTFPIFVTSLPVIIIILVDIVITAFTVKI